MWISPPPNPTPQHYTARAHKGEEESGDGIGKGGKGLGLNFIFSLNNLMFDPDLNPVALLSGSKTYLAKPLKTKLVQPEPPTQPPTTGKPEESVAADPNKIKI